MYKLTTHDPRRPALNTSRWEPVYQSKYGKVRIVTIKKVSKKSKNWVKNQTNLLCDAPGSWFCPGQYPPAVGWLIDLRKPFRQLEDFNSGPRDKDSEEYTKKYHEKMSAREGKGEIPPTEKLTYAGCIARRTSYLPRRFTVVASWARRRRPRSTARSQKALGPWHVKAAGHALRWTRYVRRVVNDGGCARPCRRRRLRVGCADAGCDGAWRIKPTRRGATVGGVRRRRAQVAEEEAVRLRSSRFAGIGVGGMIERASAVRH